MSSYLDLVDDVKYLLLCPPDPLARRNADQASGLPTIDGLPEINLLVLIVFRA